MEGKLVDELLSVMVEYLRRNIIYQAVLLYVVNGHSGRWIWHSEYCQQNCHQINTGKTK